VREKRARPACKRSVTVAVSPEAQQFAQFLDSVNARSSTPGLDLAIVRDIVETHHRSSTEPEGVTYAEVDANGVPGIWCIPQDADPGRALLHFHFGGSVVASMHSDRKAAGHIAKAAGARSLVVDFRRAPEHPYPAQLDDAETAYRWLLSQGYEPHNVGSTGHSIGGTLAVMLPLRLLAKGEATPGAIVSISPWTDLTIQNATIEENAEHDKMLTKGLLELFREAWLQDPALEFTAPSRCAGWGCREDERGGGVCLPSPGTGRGGMAVCRRGRHGAGSRVR
jgi:epsilon-lactone hydrolase